MADKPTIPKKKISQIKPITKAGISFEQWARGRTDLTPEDLWEIYNRTQSLKPVKPSVKVKPQTKAGKAFADWAEERAQMTEDEMFEIEAETQGLIETQKPRITPQKQQIIKPELLITRTPYPKWWKDLIVGKIEIAGTGTQVVVRGSGGRELYVATIVVVTSGETYISFGFGGSESSGPIHLGGGTQPSGIVISMSDSPAPCGSGGFSVSSTLVDPLLPPTIGGFAVCFSEADILPT